MKANANTRPKDIMASKRNTHFNFNIVESTIEDLGGEPRISFNYDYVEIEGEITRDKLISAIIRDKYSEDAELALLHNRMVSKNLVEYEEYQAFRVEVKVIVDEILGSLT
uniref:Uncharacterized protein n=1 Tax=viral metagenome TaxID=1070528 RepID=A0A6M3JLM8_9ZZZZ